MEAALRVLDREGASGLTMRRVADELGCGAGALYWHVENKEQLVQLLFDRVIEELPQPTPDPRRWREQLKQAARDARAVLQRHPGIAQLSLGRIPLGPNALRYLEWQLAVLRAGGLPDQVVALAGDLLSLYVGAFAYEECLELPALPGGEAPLEQRLREMRDYLASLPGDRFPNVAELAGELVRANRDERFEFGLEVLVGGLAALAEGPPRRRRR